jgi:hypothetical protein
MYEIFRDTITRAAQHYFRRLKRQLNAEGFIWTEWYNLINRVARGPIKDIMAILYGVLGPFLFLY